MIEQVISLAIGVWLGGVVAFIAMATTGAWLPDGRIVRVEFTDNKTGEPKPVPGWFVFGAALLWPLTLLYVRKK